MTGDASMRDREEAETLEAIREGLASVERGEGEPLEEVARELRVRFQIPYDDGLQSNHVPIAQPRSGDSQ